MTVTTALRMDMNISSLLKIQKTEPFLVSSDSGFQNTINPSPLIEGRLGGGLKIQFTKLFLNSHDVLSFEKFILLEISSVSVKNEPLLVNIYDLEKNSLLIQKA